MLEKIYLGVLGRVRQMEDALVDVEDRCLKVISLAEVHGFARAREDTFR